MHTYKELHALTVEELEAEYDRLAKNTNVGLEFYREELARREAAEQNNRMVKMTQQMRNMTIAITVMTVANIIAVIIQLCK
ncbi:MAG: hypothetical protein HYV59_03240 [Planctomycetes bacterium]|nr:hypothetical protein [Planctomycetota bacterium]